MLEIDYTLRVVALGAAVLGTVSGALGTFAVLRGQSLLGDAVSHAALPGIALAFLVTGLKTPLVLMAGAALTGFAATLLVLGVTETSRTKYDGALALALASFFGLGLVLLTIIQKRPDAAQAGLDTFLFGQAAALLEEDVAVMAALGGVVLAAVVAFWKEFKLLAFDPAFGRTLGLPMRRLDVALTALLVVAVVIGLQTVGVVLMAALLVAPGAAARQWTDRLGRMLGLSACFGAFAGVAGAVLSASTPGLPTGPTIVLCAGAIAVVSLLFAPRRGVVSRAVAARRRARRLRLDAVLVDLYALSQEHEGRAHAHDEAVLRIMRPDAGDVRGALGRLAARGLARETETGHWTLTDAGARRAAAVEPDADPDTARTP